MSLREHILRKRTLYLPTWKGWLVLLLLLAGVATLLLRSAHPFLARNVPVAQPRIVVVEGWISDLSLEWVAAEHSGMGAPLLLCTGVDVPAGSHLLELGSFARLAEATLETLGVPEEGVHACPAGPHKRLRTFASAAAVYKWLEANDSLDARILIVTEGTHSRRSLAVYRKVFAQTSAEIGIRSLPSPNYDPEAWWKNSAGMKTVLTEGIAAFDEGLRDGGRDSNDPHRIETPAPPGTAP